MIKRGKNHTRSDILFSTFNLIGQSPAKDCHIEDLLSHSFIVVRNLKKQSFLDTVDTY